MILKYDARIDNSAVEQNLSRITNQIYKLLPTREEGLDWERPLQNLILELVGMGKLLEDHTNLFPLLCKLEALKELNKDEDFLLFRSTVFECLSLTGAIKKSICHY